MNNFIEKNSDKFTPRHDLAGYTLDRDVNENDISAECFGLASRKFIEVVRRCFSPNFVHAAGSR